jgi:formate dehydrogenase subunit delta
MANQIAAFFASEDRKTAVAETADHIHKFWDPRMRAEIIAHLAEEGDTLSETARAAVAKLAAETKAPAPAKS